jgi:copper chaperone CopZ
MKYNLFLFFMVFQFYFFYGQKKEIIKTSFKVDGVCYMCKNRIEKTVFKIKGIKHANWDISSNEILVIYDNNKASIENIHKKIAGSGHNTLIEFASDSIYNNLPECCLYKKKDKKKLLNH